MEATARACDISAAACFRFPDPHRNLAAVRLDCRYLGSPPFSYAVTTGSWELRADWPAADRIEYKFELTHRDGRTEWVLDPGEPRRAPGGFGDVSVRWAPGYREPSWLGEPAVAGQWSELRLPVLGSEITASIWSPAGAQERVLVAHDGPDYHRFGELGRFLAASIAAGRVAPCHLVLLPANDRLEWYSASPAYAKSLAREILPRVTARIGAGRPVVVGAGASLGAFAMLHAQRRYPASFAGLFLQSGSYFQPRLDSQESGFPRWPRMVRFVGRMRRAASGPAIPAALTCGTVEENLANNQAMAHYLRSQGYAVSFAENRDAHTWIGWRDALDPHLTVLLQRTF
jgi:enterochelin esterase family protein